MWSYHDMSNFPSTDLLDDNVCPYGLERPLHPEGLKCPHCESPDRRLFRDQGHVPTYRCRGCQGYDTLLSGTIVAKTRQPPGTLGRWLRGMAQGEPTARLARERRRSRTPLQTLRPCIQAHRNETASPDVMSGTALTFPLHEHGEHSCGLQVEVP